MRTRRESCSDTGCSCRWLRFDALGYARVYIDIAMQSDSNAIAFKGDEAAIKACCVKR